MSKAIAVAKPSIESVGAESHQPSPHATKSRKQKLIDAPRQSNTSVKALANEAVTVNDHPTRPPRLILIVAPVSSRLSRDIPTLPFPEVPIHLTQTGNQRSTRCAYLVLRQWSARGANW